MNNSLKMFLLLAEELSFVKAANKAFITQQCLSDHIKRLEEKYGTKLFYRKPKIALTPAEELILIRQFRHGTRRTEWEVPGGCIDRSDSSPVAAGIRELREETGYAGENARIIGRVHPNPALQGNVCHTIRIDRVEKYSAPDLEATECIVTEAVPVKRVEEMIRSGEITHGLVLNALMFYLYNWENV